MSRDRAFELLLSQNYSSFILTIECIGVSIYHTDNGSYKIFDSHARDEYGRSHPFRYMCTIRGTIYSGLSTVFPDYTLPQ